MKNYSSKFKIIFVLIITFVLFPSASFAASLYLEPLQGEYQSGDTFMVEIRLDAEKENINVVEATLTFSNDILEVKDFSSGNSILTLWVERPVFSNQEGRISFIGGIPGSYSGKNGILGKIAFRVKEVNTEKTAEVKFLDSSKVLLDDQKGTQANLIAKRVIFKILPEISTIIKKEWEEELQKDKIPPEPFKIEISQDPSVFDGKYFIAFSTTDKQSGVDHYEVKEGKREWRLAESPYLLENQSLGEEIKVKVVDKAGNERIQMIKFEARKAERKIGWKDILPWIILIVIVIGAGITWWIIKSRNRRKTLRETETKL